MDVELNEDKLILTAVHLRAVELKYEGYTYAEMETLLKEQFPDSYLAKGTLANYFSRGGLLYEYYEKYQKEQSEISIKEARTLWQNHAKNAMRTVLSLMQKADKGDTKLKAAQEILGRAFGAVPKIVYQPEDKDLLDEVLKDLNLIKDDELGTGKNL
jgi:hypothetical protein